MGDLMIRIFDNCRRLLFFPKSWANSVSRWLLGVYSPTGTIRIQNTANPDDVKSVAFDVDVDAVAGEIKQRLQGFSPEQRRVISSIIRSSLDGVSAVWTSGGVSVSAEWIERLVANALQNQQASGVSKTLKLCVGYEENASEVDLNFANVTISNGLVTGVGEIETVTVLCPPS